MSTCMNEEGKVNNTELKYCRCQNTKTRKAKENVQKWNTLDVKIFVKAISNCREYENFFEKSSLPV